MTEKKLPLRIGVGVIVLNNKNKIFVGKRKDNPVNKWQMPQGGINENENFLAAMKRELNEETSIKSIKILKELDEWFEYELPKNLVGKIVKLPRGLFPANKGKVLSFDGESYKVEVTDKRDRTSVVTVGRAAIKENLEEEYYHISDATYDDGTLAEDLEFWDDVIVEAEYQGRKVTLNKPMQGDVKKFKVYVKNPKGNVIKVNFGHGGSSVKGKAMRIRKNNPKARKSFRARHNCANPGSKTKARYWSCRKW